MRPLLFLLSACAAVVVFASPHNIHAARHHAIAARAAVAVPDDTPLRRRQSNKRCKNRSSSSGSPSPTPAVKLVSSTDNPKPTTSTTPYVYKPVPTTTTQPPVVKPTPTPTTTAQSNNLPSFMYGTQTGQGTFFDVAVGACGVTNKGTDFVAALSWRLFDNYPGYNGVNPNNNPVCGKKITANYQGKSVTITVVDRCADDTCLVGNIDFSRSAFAQLADFSVGRIYGMTWTWAS